MLSAKDMPQRDKRKILKEVNRDQDVDYIRNMIRSSGENIWQNQEMADDCTFLVLKVGSNGDKELESLDGVS